jgi:hypothetical protein
VLYAGVKASIGRFPITGDLLELVKNVGLIAAVAAIALFAPARTQPATEVTVKLSDLPPVVVNLTTETAPVNVTVPEQPAPVINVTVPKSEPFTVIVEPAPVLPAEVVYRDREVERIVKVPACLDYADLPHFDLANALSVAFPGAQWSLNGSYYPGLVWLDDSPQPDMTSIIGGWLTSLSKDC